MSIRKIGIDAGIVWQILNVAKDRSCSYDELKLKSKLSDNALIEHWVGLLVRTSWRLMISLKSYLCLISHSSNNQWRFINKWSPLTLEFSIEY